MVIATVFLSIIGMSAGLALGSRHKASPESPGLPHIPESPAASNGGVECPAEMHATARRLGITDTLTQVMRVRTTDTKTVTTIWICRGPDDALYYQANRGDGWVEGKTALFLTRVDQEGDGYVAKAVDGTVIRVDERQLRIFRKKGVETHDVEPE